jgi:murein L,D-transpeptidase YcbB/YkuD
MTGQTDPAFEALWKHALDAWDDQRAHGAFLEYCRSTQRLAEAAARYRGMTSDRETAEIAQQKLTAVVLLAMSQLETSRSERAARPSRSTYALLAFLLAATIGLLAYVATTR